MPQNKVQSVYHIFRITDGTAANTIDLLSGLDGFMLRSWRPKIAAPKGGGTWRQSALSDGRRLVAHRRDNVTDLLELEVTAAEGSALIHATQNMRRLLEQAADYWETGRGLPVWIEKRAKRETASTYALIYFAQAPEDDDPYSPQYVDSDPAAMDAWNLEMEHGPWLARRRV